MAQASLPLLISHQTDAVRGSGDKPRSFDDKLDLVGLLAGWLV